MTFDGSDYQFEAENLDFVEPQPGVFMPIRCVRRGREGDHYNESVTSITDVQINRPIPDRVFQLPRVPSGTPLDDEVRGTKYTIDSEWQRIGKEEPIVTLRVAQPAEEEQSEYSSQSVSEPGSFTRWIIPLSIVILAGAGVAWYIRRRRRRRDEDGVAAERA
jgi:hypothetical protein